MNVKNKLYGFAISTILATSLVGVPSASAASYYCDNDAQGYNCYNTSYGSWQHKLNQSGSWNGDHRIITANNDSGWYRWIYTEDLDSRTPSVYVWLANDDFTNTNARYYLGDTSPSTGRLIGSINQNTAISGWNYIGGGITISYSNANLEVNQKDWNNNTNTVTGADYVELRTSSRFSLENIIQDDEILSIQNKMFNAIDYYKTIQGSFRIYFSNIQQDQVVDFEINHDNNAVSHTIVRNSTGEKIEHIFDGNYLYYLDHNQKTFDQSKVAIESVNNSIEAQVARNNNNEKVFVRRQDPTWAHIANEVTLPQNYAAWLSEGTAEIVATETLLGREVTVIEGTLEPYLANKLGAKNYKLWVDSKTGVLLKLEGTDDGGNKAYFIEVTDIKFDEVIEDGHFNVHLSDDWEDRSLNKRS